MSDEDVSSSPLFKLGRSPVSVVEATPIFVEDGTEPDPIPADMGFGSVDEDVAVGNEELVGGVVVEVALDSVLDEEVVSVLPTAAAGVTVVAFVAAVDGAAEDVIDEDAADVVAVVVLVELVCAVVVVTGGEEFVFVGATTYDVPKPNKCPQYLLSSISSSKNISFMRKNVCPVSKASDPA
jgi:uncharacterized membrane protein